MKLIQKILIYSFFLGLGLLLFWWLYKDLDWKRLMQGFRITNYYWILISIIIGLFSHYIRSIRWNMLITPLGYHPKISNIFLSILIMYFTNLLVPRAGEVARCTVLARYEKIPVSKLIGTMVVERIADIITMITLLIIILVVNIGIVKEFFIQNPTVRINMNRLFSLSNILIALTLTVGFIILLFVFKPFNHTKFGSTILKIKKGFTEGIQSILKLDNRWYFMGHTLLIFVCWLFMLYVVFKAFPPTQHLTIEAGMFTFLMGGLAMLAPVQGGIGAWHYMVIKSLFLFGISEESGKIFALVAHTSTNLIYLIFGLIAFGLLPLLNRKSIVKGEIREQIHDIT